MSDAFAQRVAAQVRRLEATPLGIIDAEVAAGRKQWIEQRYTKKQLGPRPSPRAAFEALFFDYMGLRPEDLEVVRDDAAEISWLSRNPCPTLEACGRLGLDTRKVCRSAYEKSTQAFVSGIDPELRFLRDYREIRPYAPHCRERIVRVDFVQMMRLAIDEARQSRAEGNKGYGAVAALGNQVVACTHDTASTQRDPSAHAELNAIRQAAAALGDGDLSGVVIFSTCEPCPMCASLAVWANAGAIVFGASIQKTAALGKARIHVPAREIVARGPVMVEVIDGVLEPECLALYRG
ncbi:MAG TPA: nucleoside deaminase [Bryobacteraceae bacterium]|nr:nucleoside deaminase [Bryobacteraceae bacterium]